MLGERLKQARKALNLSQEKMAKELGTSAGYISEIESGKKKSPGSEFLASLLGRFNLNINWLLNGEGEMFVLSPDYTPERCFEIVADFYDLDEKDMEEILLTCSKYDKIADILKLIINAKMGNRKSFEQLKQIIQGMELMLE